MGRIQIQYIEGNNIYNCKTCGTHLSSYNMLISKAFRGRGGKAFLFDNALNYECGPLEERELMTGKHLVCDIFCKRCKINIGWKYEKAFVESQKYKEGKIILEKIQIGKFNWNI